MFYTSSTWGALHGSLSIETIDAFVTLIPSPIEIAAVLLLLTYDNNEIMQLYGTLDMLFL